jgi:hypothetical protein
LRIFLSFHSKDQALAEALSAGLNRLEPGADIFFSPVSLGAGFWQPKLAEEIAAADAFLLLIGPGGIGLWQDVEYNEAFDRHLHEKDRFPLIPVIAANAKVPGLPFLRRLNWVEAPVVVNGLNELMPHGDWKAKLEEAERAAGRPLTPEERKGILVGAFTESLARLGKYQYVAETTVLRPLKDRPLYCLCYASRHERGIEVFRDCQVKALIEQSRTRAATKVKHAAASSGQGEFFPSMHDMGPDELKAFLDNEKKHAEVTLIALVPRQPASIPYEKLWPQVLSRHVVRLPDVNGIAARLRASAQLLFPDWEKGKRVPQSRYRTQKP